MASACSGSDFVVVKRFSPSITSLPRTCDTAADLLSPLTPARSQPGNRHPHMN
ncbi:hypothetical protein CZ674_07790 [Agrococcus casei LMG 22410]|uniref:Uncharacterized protein n=1 Tax=Agrococcus casei LMG 22410 TaxID=1255656 RepID=A0A1R4G081_9MICO|nr:hypothetical protein CZ674_07790 [Agrococcus casei LMG 22410]